MNAGCETIVNNQRVGIYREGIDQMENDRLGIEICHWQKNLKLIGRNWHGPNELMRMLGGIIF